MQISISHLSNTMYIAIVMYVPTITCGLKYTKRTESSDLKFECLIISCDEIESLSLFFGVCFFSRTISEQDM